MFLEYLNEVSPEKEINFKIDIFLDTRLISILPCTLSLVVFKELKEKLNELLDKGFMRPSISLWGTLVLYRERREMVLLGCSMTCWTNFRVLVNFQR